LNKTKPVAVWPTHQHVGDVKHELFGLPLCQLHSALCVTCRSDSCNGRWDSLCNNLKSVTDESQSERLHGGIC